MEEASLILMSVKPELMVSGKLQTRTMLTPFGCKEVKVMHGEEEDRSAGRLVVPKFPDGIRDEEQGHPSSGKNPRREDGQGSSFRSDEKEDDKTLTGGMSSLDFNFLSNFENGTDTLEAMTEPADEGTSTLEPPSVFMEMSRNLLEKNLLLDSPRRRRIEGTARVHFLRTMPKEEWEVHHTDHENRTGCSMDRVAFMEEVWTVNQSYGTQSILKTGLNRPLMREVLDKCDESEEILSEFFIDSATDESEANSPTKTTPREGKEEVVYLSRAGKGAMQSKSVIDKITDMKMKLGSKVTLRNAGKTKVGSEISIKVVNSARRKHVEEAMDMGQGDDRLPGTDRMLNDLVMVPPILMAALKSASYKTKRSDCTLTGATLEIEILSQCGESFQTVFHEPWKGKRRKTASPSGVQPIDSVEDCNDL